MSDYAGAAGRGEAVILGAGITGLAAAYMAKKAGNKTILIESDSAIGGLAKTLEYRGFRFDLGGHRFVTQDNHLREFVTRLLGGRYLIVPRSSKIFLNNRYVRYPLEPINALRNVGGSDIVRIVYDYLRQKIQYGFGLRETHSLEDWVKAQYGEYLYRLFFKDYSEKVWGIDCRRIDQDWIAQRIQGLSLARALQHAFIGGVNGRVTTLADRFLYPTQGIGELATALGNGLTAQDLSLETSITRVHHEHNRITAVETRSRGECRRLKTKQVISTIPLANFARLFHPAPPQDVIDALDHLKSRDLIIVTVFLRGERVTNESWIYFPDAQIPFSRIHEPKNWSVCMAPEGKTSLVTEHFCFYGDATWQSTDSQLITKTVNALCALKLIEKHAVVDAMVIRVRHAYPLFELGYGRYCESVCRYFDRFTNLVVAGRTGSFRYYNLDQAMQSGFAAAQRLVGVERQNSAISLDNDVNSKGGIHHEMCTGHTRLAT